VSPEFVGEDEMLIVLVKKIYIYVLLPESEECRK
jgi:hypothetical protein